MKEPTIKPLFCIKIKFKFFKSGIAVTRSQGCETIPEMNFNG
jgi:hypothetical protein